LTAPTGASICTVELHPDPIKPAWQVRDKQGWCCAQGVTHDVHLVLPGAAATSTNTCQPSQPFKGDSAVIDM
jgi:hypothetical protein